jgi:hypothetical protein
VANSTRLLAFLVTLQLLLLGCTSLGVQSADRQAGFLGDDSQLLPGRGDQAQLIYINPRADFGPYQRIIIDPVVVWRPNSAQFSGLSRADLDALAGSLWAAMQSRFALEFEVVETPGPGTMRIRNALTAVTMSPADPERVERVAIEVEVVDAQTNARLVAAKDARGEAGNSSSATAEPAVDIQTAFLSWASRASARLAALRSFDARHTERTEEPEP